MLIGKLSDHREVIPTLVEWFLSEWEPYYGADGPGDARADLESRCNRDAIPVGLVAIESDEVLGTVALDLDVSTNLTPSVVGLVVGQPFRRRGVATALLRAVEDLARRLGYRRIYVSTGALGALLTRLGWEVRGDVRFLNDEHGSVYVRNL